MDRYSLGGGQMKVIKMDENQLNNLKIFLGRVDLKGQEAIEFVKIVQSLERAEDEGGEE